MFCKVSYFSKDTIENTIGKNLNADEFQWIDGEVILNLNLISSIDDLEEIVYKPNEGTLYARLTMNNGEIYYITEDSYKKLVIFISKNFASEL